MILMPTILKHHPGCYCVLRMDFATPAAWKPNPPFKMLHTLCCMHAGLDVFTGPRSRRKGPQAVLCTFPLQMGTALELAEVAEVRTSVSFK